MLAIEPPRSVVSFEWTLAKIALDRHQGPFAISNARSATSAGNGYRVVN